MRPTAPHLGAVERSVEVALTGAVLAGHAAAPSLDSVAPGDVAEADESVKPAAAAVEGGSQLVLQPSSAAAAERECGGVQSGGGTRMLRAQQHPGGSLTHQ